MLENEDRLAHIIVSLIVALMFVVGLLFSKENKKPEIIIENPVEAKMAN